MKAVLVILAVLVVSSHAIQLDKVSKKDKFFMPCKDANGGCSPDATCFAAADGSVSCKCKVGYEGNGVTCQDKNECAINNGNCGVFTCINTVGSFQCKSPCESNNGGCDAQASCQAFRNINKVSCKCNKGYAGNGKTCTKITDCSVNNGGCSAGYTCSNNKGVLSCQSACKTNNGGCNSLASCRVGDAGVKCKCKKGYEGDGKTCTDVNECLKNNGDCGDGFSCVNTPGSRKCVSPCDTDNGGCSPFATCKPSKTGAPQCTCKKGFTGTGLVCTDVNECLVNNGGCKTGYVCMNKIGSFSCKSPCKDPAKNTCHRYAKCSTDDDGTIKCACKKGFTGDGKSCTDVNECQTSNGGCKAGFTCVNTIGSFACLSPCEEKNGGCDQYATCSVTPKGAVSCACKKGFTGDGKSCKDIDECLTNNGGCPAKTKCRNTIGGRVCEK